MLPFWHIIFLYIIELVLVLNSWSTPPLTLSNNQSINQSTCVFRRFKHRNHSIQRLYLCLLAHSNVQHVLTIWVTWWVSYKRQELLTPHESLGSPPVFDGVRIVHIFSFLLCCVFVFYLSSSWSLSAQRCHCLRIVHSLVTIRLSLSDEFRLS